MRRVLQIVFVLFVLVVAALAAIPFIVTPDFVARQVSAAVTEQTGRDLRMGGEPSFSFWPELGVTLHDVALTNPPEMGEGNVAQMDRLSVGVAVMPLLSGTVEVTEFVVERPRLDLLIDSEGRSNWNFAKEDGGESAPDAGTQQDGEGGLGVTGVQLAPIRIVDGSLRYLDERSGTNFSADDVDVTLNFPDLDSPFEAEGSLTWNGDRVAVSVFAKKPMALAGGGASPVSVSLNAPLITTSFSGQAALQDGLSLAGRVDVETSSLRNLAKWAGNPLAPGRGLEAFRADGAIDITAQTITLEDANITLDGMRANGTMRVELAGARPKVVASLGLDRLDLDTYLGGGGDGSSGGSGGAAAGAGWSTEPINFSGLKAVDAQLTLVASQIIYGDVTTGKTSLEVTLDNGVLNADLGELALYGGQAAGTFILNGDRQVPTVQAGFRAEGFNGYELLRDFAGFEWIEGQASTVISVAAAGNSQHDLVSSLKGTTGFTFTDGAIRGINIAQMIRGVSQNILSGWEQTSEQKTDFSLMEANFNIAQGRAVNDNLQLVGPLVRVAGGGVVDLPQKSLDYRVDPKLVASLEGQGGDTGLKGLGVPVVIRGSWSDPRIYPDIEGILQNPEAAYDKIKGLVGEGAGIDLGKGVGSLKEGIEGTITEEAEGLLGEDAGKAVGEQGKKLLKGLFGGKKDGDGDAAPAPEPAPSAETQPESAPDQDGGPTAITPDAQAADPGAGIDEESKQRLDQTLQNMFGGDDEPAAQ